MDGPALHLGDVRGKARRSGAGVRRRGGRCRRRRWRSPVPVGDHGRPARINTSKQRAAPRRPPRVRRHRTMLTLDGLERGDAPDGRVLHRRRGRPAGRGHWRPLHDSYQAHGAERPTRGRRWSAGLDELRVAGRRLPSRTGRSGPTSNFVSNPDRTAVACTTGDAAAQTLRPGADATVGTLGERGASRRTPTVDPVDLRGPTAACSTNHRLRGVDARPSASRRPTARSRSRVASSTAMQRTRRRAWSPVQTESSADGSGCFGVVDPAVSTAGVGLGTCDHALGAFSPDGRYVLASDPLPVGRRTCLA